MKKFLASFLIICTLCTSTISLAFSDVVSNHWAKGAIDNMVKEGIISGYTDGTFRPSRNISKIESLILLSKIAGVNKYSAEASSFESKYESLLDKYQTSYKKQVAYLLGVSVLKEADLPNLLNSDKINSPLTREEMAILVTKILGKEEAVKNKSMYILPFKDVSKISSSARTYVEFVYNEGIMNGIDKENFSPDTYVTRAQAAVILNSIYKKVDIKPIVQTASGTIKGEITTIAQALGVMWIKDNANFEDSYEYDKNTKIYVNNKLSKDSDLKEGMTVEATVVDEVITVLKAETKYDYDIDTTSTSASGKIVDIEKAGDEYILKLKSGSKTKYYVIDGNTEFYIDDDDADLDDFDDDDEVTLKLDHGYVEEMEKEGISVDIDENSDTAKGTIVSISKGKKETIIGLKVGTKTKYYIADSDTEYYIGNDEKDLEDFYTEDSVELDLDEGYIYEMYRSNKISIDKSSTSRSGVITVIKKGIEDSIVGIKSGSTTKYYIVDDESYLEIDDEEVKIEDFAVGDDVDVELSDGYIDDMILVEASNSSSSSNDDYMVGKITNIDEDDEIIKIKVGSSTKTIYTDSDYVIIDVETANDLDLDDLWDDDKIAVFGYTKNSKFYATVIVYIE